METKNNQEIIFSLLENNEFLKENEVLKTAYLLGMLSSALINWQLGVSGGMSSFNKWLNNSGTITKENLERIFKKTQETIRKLNSTSRGGNKIVNDINELVIDTSSITFLSKKIVKSSYTTLAFAMGGNDFKKKIKKEKK